MSAELQKRVFELRQNLTHEANQQGLFLRALEDHRRAILSFDTEKIERSNLALAETSAKGIELRRQGQLLLQNIARLMGVDARGLRLSQIARASGDGALEDLRATLSEMARQVESSARSVLMLNRSHAEAYSSALRILIGDDPLDAQERRRSGGILINEEA